MYVIICYNQALCSTGSGPAWSASFSASFSVQPEIGNGPHTGPNGPHEVPSLEPAPKGGLDGNCDFPTWQHRLFDVCPAFKLSPV